MCVEVALTHTVSWKWDTNASHALSPPLSNPQIVAHFYKWCSLGHISASPSSILFLKNLFRPRNLFKNMTKYIPFLRNTGLCIHWISVNTVLSFLFHSVLVKLIHPQGFNYFYYNPFAYGCHSWGFLRRLWLSWRFIVPNCYLGTWKNLISSVQKNLLSKLLAG